MSLHKLLVNDAFDTPADFWCTPKLEQTKEINTPKTATDPLRDRFHRIRDDTLRSWYLEANSADKQTRKHARRRLQLQRNIRVRRAALEECKERRDACKSNGDKTGARTAQKEIYKVNECVNSSSVGMIDREKISVVQKKKLLKQWQEDTATVEDMLIGLEHGRVEDFGVLVEEEEW